MFDCDSAFDADVSYDTGCAAAPVTYTIPSGLNMKQKKALAALLACRPCCEGGSGSGSGTGTPVQYTSCRCGYPWTLNESDPQPPPQPAGGYFPTIIYHDADYTGDCNCHQLVPVTDTVPCPPFALAATGSTTVSSYCSSYKRIPLYYCPGYLGSGIQYDSGAVPLCDYTFTTRNRFTGASLDSFTIRRFIQIIVTVECTECENIDGAWLADRGLDPELYESWIGLEYCPPATATVNRIIRYKTVSQSLSGGADMLYLDAIPTVATGGDMGLPCDLPPCGTPATLCDADGGRVRTRQVGVGQVYCTDINLLPSTGTYNFSMSLYCCTSANPFPSSLTAPCCIPTNERLVVPC